MTKCNCFQSKEKGVTGSESEAQASGQRCAPAAVRLCGLRTSSSRPASGRHSGRRCSSCYRPASAVPAGAHLPVRLSGRRPGGPVAGLHLSRSGHAEQRRQRPGPVQQPAVRRAAQTGPVAARVSTPGQKEREHLSSTCSCSSQRPLLDARVSGR